jgi:hypothetical protein
LISFAILTPHKRSKSIHHQKGSEADNEENESSSQFALCSGRNLQIRCSPLFEPHKHFEIILIIMINVWEAEEQCSRGVMHVFEYQKKLLP